MSFDYLSVHQTDYSLHRFWTIKFQEPLEISKESIDYCFLGKSLTNIDL